MFITNEYTVLVKDDKEIRILPNIPFEEIPEGYTVTSYATIKDKEGEIVMILAPGTVTTQLKGRAKQDFSELSSQELREILRNEGISFLSKATKSELVELLGQYHERL